MEERDLYNENRELINKTILKDDVIPEGNFILVVVGFLENFEGKYLIQKRSELKGGEWALTGGHPKHGETSLEGIKTEFNEELGVNIQEPILFKSVKGKNTFCDLYYIKQNIDLNKVIMQDEEVSDVMFATKEEIDILFEEGKFKKGHYMMFNDYLQYKNENKLN